MYANRCMRTSVCEKVKGLQINKSQEAENFRSLASLRGHLLARELGGSLARSIVCPCSVHAPI